jgi:hypothetical protein
MMTSLAPSWCSSAAAGAGVRARRGAPAVPNPVPRRPRVQLPPPLPAAAPCSVACGARRAAVRARAAAAGQQGEAAWESQVREGRVRSVDTLGAGAAAGGHAGGDARGTTPGPHVLEAHHAATGCAHAHAAQARHPQAW